MQVNDFVKVAYQGKIKESGQNLDKTDSTPVIVGAGFCLKGIDEALQQMNVGEKKTIKIIPEKGFGSRNPKLIKLISIAEFRKHGQKPVPGMMVNADNMRGRVLSVSSGRVKVDFNHPLAGKVLEYELEVKEKIEKPEDKILALTQYFTGVPTDKLKVEIKGKEAEVIVPPMINSIFKKKTAENVMKFLGLEKVKFAEVYEKPGQKQAEELKNKL